MEQSNLEWNEETLGVRPTLEDYGQDIQGRETTVIVCPCGCKKMLVVYVDNQEEVCTEQTIALRAESAGLSIKDFRADVRAKAGIPDVIGVVVIEVIEGVYKPESFVDMLKRIIPDDGTDDTDE